MGKTKRPIKDIIKEKIGWLEKQCREKNNDWLTEFPGSRYASNEAFGDVMDNLHGVRDYLLSDTRPGQVVKEPIDE